MSTVKQLMRVLKTLDPDMIVSIASDAEGNEINEWSGDVSLAFTDPDDPNRVFSGWVYDDDDQEVEVTSENANAVTLWP